MAWQFVPISITTILSAAMSAALGVYAWQRRHSPVGLSFAGVCLAVFIWAAGESFKLGVQDEGVFKTSVYVSFVGIVILPFMFATFAALYTGRGQLLNKWTMGTMGSVALFLIIIIWTNESHHLFYEQISIADGFIRGPMFAVHAFYSYTLIGISLFLMGRMWWRKSAVRGRTALLLAAWSLPFVVNALVITDSISRPNNIDWTPVAFGISSIVVAISLYRGGIFNVIPMARQTIISNMPDGIFVLDDDHRLVEMNTAGSEILGRTLHQAVGQVILPMLGHEAQIIRKALEDPDGRERIEVELPRPGHSEPGIYDIRISPLMDGRDVQRGHVMVMRDITAIKQTTAELRLQRELAEQIAEKYRVARDEADVANRAKNTFLANMSHEFRTPLNAIMGYTELIQEDLQINDTDSELKQDVTQIHDSAQHLLGIIEDVFDMSRLEAQKVEFYLEQFPLNGLLHELEEIFTPLATAEQIDFSLTIEGELPAVYADERRVRQILMKLLSNALKFTEEGAITLTLNSEVDVHGHRWVVCHIQDTGIGIPSAQMHQLFLPFSQVDSSMTRRHDGVGLGLSISKKLLDFMGGTIRAESQPGEGTTFIVRLPTTPDVVPESTLRAKTDA